MGIKNKRLFALLLVILMGLSMAACGNDQETDQNISEAPSSDPINTEESEAQSESIESDGYEKFSQLEIGMTESEVNAILDEPTKVDKAYYYYTVMVNGQEAEVQVWINTTSGLVTYISGDFNEDKYRAEFADSATDLSAAGDLEGGKLNTYEACAEAFKTSGYLIGIDEDGETRYLWVDSNDGHMCITFDADGNVKSYVGYC